jgi:hypothetical protein
MHYYYYYYYCCTFLYRQGNCCCAHYSYSKLYVNTPLVLHTAASSHCRKLSTATADLKGIVLRTDCLYGLVVRDLGYRFRGPGSITGTTRKKVVGLERGPLSLASTTEELLDRKVAAPV